MAVLPILRVAPWAAAVFIAVCDVILIEGNLRLRPDLRAVGEPSYPRVTATAIADAEWYEPVDAPTESEWSLQPGKSVLLVVTKSESSRCTDALALWQRVLHASPPPANVEVWLAEPAGAARSSPERTPWVLAGVTVRHLQIRDLDRFAVVTGIKAVPATFAVTPTGSVAAQLLGVPSEAAAREVLATLGSGSSGCMRVIRRAGIEPLRHNRLITAGGS